MNSQIDDTNLFCMVPQKELDRLVRIEDKLDRLLSMGITKPQLIGGGLGHFISEKEVQVMLGLKYGALYKLRENGVLSFSKLSGKVFYDKREILQLIEKNMNKAFNKKKNEL